MSYSWFLFDYPDHFGIKKMMSVSYGCLQDYLFASVLAPRTMATMLQRLILGGVKSQFWDLSKVRLIMAVSLTFVIQCIQTCTRSHSRRKNSWIQSQTTRCISFADASLDSLRDLLDHVSNFLNDNVGYHPADQYFSTSIYLYATLVNLAVLSWFTYLVYC
jgi:hypothetical protein